MRKKLLSLCIILSLCLLTACGKEGSVNTGKETAQASVDAKAEASDTSAEETKSPAPTQTPIPTPTPTPEPELTTVYLVSKSTCDADAGPLFYHSVCEYEYNDNGKAIKKSFYGADDTLSGTQEYEYDSNGELTKQVNYKKDGSELSTCLYKYEYDSNGNMIKSAQYSESYENDPYLIFEYDVEGNVIKSTANYSDFGTGMATFEYIFDDKGRVIKRTEYDESGAIGGVKETEYYDNGDVKKFVSTNPDGTVAEYNEYEYEYDENGNIIKEITYDQNGNKEFTTEYEYITMEIPVE